MDVGEDVNMVEEAYMLDNDDGDYDSDDKAIQDGGAASVLGSVKQLRYYLRFLVEKGFDIHGIRVCKYIKTFSYGNSQIETTERCLILPLFIGGQRIDVLTYIIRREIPILMGKPILEELGLAINYGAKTMRWPGTNGKPLRSVPEESISYVLGRTSANAEVKSQR